MILFMKSGWQLSECQTTALWKTKTRTRGWLGEYGMTLLDKAATPQNTTHPSQTLPRSRNFFGRSIVFALKYFIQFLPNVSYVEQAL
jgi:hypothetical protein